MQGGLTVGIPLVYEHLGLGKKELYHALAAEVTCPVEGGAVAIVFIIQIELELGEEVEDGGQGVPLRG